MSDLLTVILHVLAIFVAIILIVYRKYLAREFIKFQNEYFGFHFSDKDVVINEKVFIGVAILIVMLMVYEILINFV